MILTLGEKLDPTLGGGQRTAVSEDNSGTCSHFPYYLLTCLFIYLFINLYDSLDYMYVHHTHALCLRMPGKGVGPFGTEVTNSCVPTM